MTILKNLTIIAFSSITIIAASASAATTKDQTKSKKQQQKAATVMKKSKFIMQYEKTAPKKICALLQKTYSSGDFKLSGLGKDNQKCISDITPIIQKYVDKYYSSFPLYLNQNKMKTYSNSVRNAAGKEYIQTHMEIPKKTFLNKYTTEQMIEPLCHNSHNSQKQQCIKNMTSLMKKCTAKISDQLPDTINYTDFQKANKMIQPCFVDLYLKQQKAI